MTRYAAAVLGLFVMLGAGLALGQESEVPPPAGGELASPEPAATGATAEGVSGTPTQRLRSLGGVVAVLAVAFLLSENKRAISRRVVLWGLGLQFGLGVFLLRVPIGREMLRVASEATVAVLDCAIDGAEFVFGPQLVNPGGPAGFVFAFRVLPTIIFVACLFAVLYHLRVMPLIVRTVAWVMARLMGTSGAETLNVAASLFLGQTEAPLTIRPYLLGLTRSELMLVMVAGMAHVSGGILAAYLAEGAAARDILTAILMNAPGAILLAKMLIPETGTPETLGEVAGGATEPDANVLAAAARGTSEGLGLALNVAAILITFVALIALVDLLLGLAGSGLQEVFGPTPWLEGLTLGRLMGAVMAPVAWVIGIPWEDSPEVGGLLGTRLVLNELIAYGELGDLTNAISPRSFTLASVALCGFANISSIGIQIGGIGALVPQRRDDLARLGPRALVAATLANLLVASIVGVLI
jgi:CNT family concentrative nucleoside transporter